MVASRYFSHLVRERFQKRSTMPFRRKFAVAILLGIIASLAGGTLNVFPASSAWSAAAAIILPLEISTLIVSCISKSFRQALLLFGGMVITAVAICSCYVMTQTHPDAMDVVVGFFFLLTVVMVLTVPVLVFGYGIRVGVQRILYAKGA